MDKIAGKDEMTNSDGVINPKLVFSDDALVVDYLNHLLASTPTTTTDSGEIHFVHMPTWSGLEPAVPSNTFVDNSLIFGIEHSKIAAEGLRKENESLKFNTERLKIEVEVLRSEYENLKFNTELAHIDIQVLRSENNKLRLNIEHFESDDQAIKVESNNLRLAAEHSKTEVQQLTSDNDNLKEEIACLMTQLIEIRSTLDVTSTENQDLRLRLEMLQSQLAMAPAITTNAEPLIIMDSVPDEGRTEEESDLDPEEAVPHVNVDSETVPREEAVAAAPVAHLAPPAISEIRQELIPKPVVVQEQAASMSDSIGQGRDAKTKITMPPPPLNDVTTGKTDSDRVLRPPATAVIDTPAQKSKPAPKVIGQHYVRKSQNDRPPNPALQAATQGTVRSEESHKDVEQKPVFIQEVLVVEPEDVLKSDPASNKETQHAFDADEIKLEPAPAPKVVVRKNVMNYVDLQKEAEPTNATKAVHAIIL